MSQSQRAHDGRLQLRCGQLTWWPHGAHGGSNFRPPLGAGARFPVCAVVHAGLNSALTPQRRDD